ncbi:MAG: hypothetical protein ACRD6N_20225 [Pyrinomonadaceae bacterium]
MRFHVAWLAAGLSLSVVLACSSGKMKNANVSTNTAASNSSTAGSDAGPGTFIGEIHMAKDDGRGDPGAQADSFGPDDRTIHCVTTLKEAKAGTRLKFSWWTLDAEGSKNEKIKDIDYTTKSLEDVVHSHLTLPRDWPRGKYKVDVYVNDNLDKTIRYGVQ